MAIETVETNEANKAIVANNVEASEVVAADEVVAAAVAEKVDLTIVVDKVEEADEAI